MNSTIIIGGTKKTVPAKGVTYVDNAALNLNFITIHKNSDGHRLTVVAKEGDVEHERFACGDVEQTKLVNLGKGSLAKKWRNFSMPDYIVRVGCAVIYTSEAKLARAIEIAKGEIEVDGWIRQELEWYDLDGRGEFRDLLFLNLTRHCHVPPAKWFVPRPAECRFSREKLNPLWVALGVMPLNDMVDNGRVYKQWGRLERYGGANSFAVVDTTQLESVAREWMERSGWRFGDNAKTATRVYDNGDRHIVKFASDQDAASTNGNILCDYELAVMRAKITSHISAMSGMVFSSAQSSVSITGQCNHIGAESARCVAV